MVMAPVVRVVASMSHGCGMFFLFFVKMVYNEVQYKTGNYNSNNDVKTLVVVKCASHEAVEPLAYRGAGCVYVYKQKSDKEIRCF